MYILFTGAPGSKWSSVAESLSRSPDIDNSDSTSERVYNNGEVKHKGSYFDPGMEFTNDRVNWDKPFTGRGLRIIKSHTFAHKLYELKDHGHPMVLVYRSNLECYDWWVQAGGFNITYPDYSYYGDLDSMRSHIENQNKDIMKFVMEHQSKIYYPKDNFDLCSALGIKSPPRSNGIHTYAEKDIKVYLYK